MSIVVLVRIIQRCSLSAAPGAEGSSSRPVRTLSSWHFRAGRPGSLRLRQDGFERREGRGPHASDRMDREVGTRSGRPPAGRLALGRVMDP